MYFSNILRYPWDYFFSLFGNSIFLSFFNKKVSSEFSCPSPLPLQNWYLISLNECLRLSNEKASYISWIQFIRYWWFFLDTLKKMIIKNKLQTRVWPQWQTKSLEMLLSFEIVIKILCIILKHVIVNNSSPNSTFSERSILFIYLIKEGVFKAIE